ncbi:MAG: metal ABC transporter substrate-binding protein, partial [Anaerolineales bacterium]
LLAACGSSPGPSSGKLEVVVTTTILGDVVGAVGGENIDITVLLPAEADPHAYEPAPRDAALISGADLLFINGLGLEPFLDPLMANVSSGTQVTIVSDGIAPMEGEPDEHRGAAEGEEALELDPHVWQDPRNVIIWVENITAALADADSAHAEEYQANATAYVAELEEVDSWIVEQVSVLPPERRVLVTDHEALGYFARRFEFEIVGVVIPSVSTLAAPSAQEMAKLHQEIVEHGAPAIFIGTSANPDLVTQLGLDLGIAIVPIYGEALSAAGGPASTYLDMMRFNVNAIVNALQ